MGHDIARYVVGPSYQEDLSVTSELWHGPGILGTAGMFIFLSYITIPELVSVRPVLGYPRTLTMRLGLDGEREKIFLQRMVGLSVEDMWHGGISNIRVCQMVAGLGVAHSQFQGMQNEYMDYFAAIIALSVLRTYAARNVSIDHTKKAAYWRYMQHALSLLGTHLPDEDEAHRRCHQFVDEYAEPCTDGSILLGSLLSVYARYIDKALPTLFPKSHAVVLSLLELSYGQLLAPVL